MAFRVAIDGPAGSGKSTISKLVAQELNFTHIDTGSMFRAIALYKINNNKNDYKFLDEIDILYKDGKIYLNNIDVSEEVRKNNVTDIVSEVAKNKDVRKKVLEIERTSANCDCILDGRDIGTKVLPDAELKIYLTADAKKRALRRYIDNVNRGIESDIVELENDIKKRDNIDETRAESPLKKAEDAILLDTSDMSIEEVKNKIISLIKERY